MRPKYIWIFIMYVSVNWCENKRKTVKTATTKSSLFAITIYYFYDLLQLVVLHFALKRKASGVYVCMVYPFIIKGFSFQLVKYDIISCWTKDIFECSEWNKSSFQFIYLKTVCEEILSLEISTVIDIWTMNAFYVCKYK